MIQKKIIKSYVKRMSRMTLRQKLALANLSPKYVLHVAMEELNLAQLFQRNAATVLEIGFGNGDSLLQMAETYPELNFIGIEVHLPGVGNLLDNIEQRQIKNIRVFQTDAINVIKNCIPDQSLSHLLIFFPDPWQKRRHHKRRLVQLEFVNLIATKLQPGGIFHFATDWEDYALHVKKVMTEATPFSKVDRAALPIAPLTRCITKFENRGKQLGHNIFDLIFVKN